MGKIYLPNQSNRPRIICPSCKTDQILDIREFNTDMTRIAKYTCKNCKNFIYAGIFLLASSNPNTLMQNIQKVIEAVNSPNTLLVGDKGKNN